MSINKQSNDQGKRKTNSNGSSNSSLNKKRASIRKKLVIIGDGACGKTSLLVAYKEGKFSTDYVPTVFENSQTTVQIEDKIIELSLWDTAGQEDYDRLRPLSYPDSNIILICFAIDNRDSFQSVEDKWNFELERYCPKVSKILVGCKSDKRDEKGVDRENLVGMREGEELASRIGAVNYVECSAKTMENHPHFNNYLESEEQSQCQSILTLTNLSENKDILFKVQTTSPSIYRVRPSNGRISCGSTTEVQIMRVSDPIKADKFLIKYVLVEKDLEINDFMKVFSENVVKSECFEHRLKVLNATFLSSNLPSSATLIDSPSVEESDSNKQLQDALNKIRTLEHENRQLLRQLEAANEKTAAVRERSLSSDHKKHPATQVPKGISQEELDRILKNQAGFPPVLVILIALFAFLVGLLF